MKKLLFLSLVVLSISGCDQFDKITDINKSIDKGNDVLLSDGFISINGRVKGFYHFCHANFVYVSFESGSNRTVAPIFNPKSALPLKCSDYNKFYSKSQQLN